MAELLRWLSGTILGLAAVIGLYIGAHAEDAGFAVFGLLLSLFSVLLLFRFIALVTGKPESHS